MDEVFLREQRCPGNQNPLVDLLDAAAVGHERRAAFCTKATGAWREVSYGELRARTRALASALIEGGVRPDERVGILAESGPEWGVAFLGVLAAGAIAVPLDGNLTDAELRPVLDDCGATSLVVSRAFAERAQNIKTLVGSIRLVLVVEAEIVDGHRLRSPDAATVRSRTFDDTAVIVYVWPTADRPRGVMFSYANLVFHVRILGRVLGIRTSDRIVSSLPVHDVVALTGGFILPLSVGATICLGGALPEQVVALLEEKKVNAMIGDPLSLSSMRARIDHELRTSRVAAVWFRLALPLAAALPWGPARRTLFQPIRVRFGRRLRVLVSGRRTLDPELARLFDRLGVAVLHGYGRTESGPLIAVNMPGANRMGTVGRPLAGVEVRIDGGEQGEILTRGPHVMQGYHEADHLTREAIDREGWLHTGDLGRFDADGFLHVAAQRSRSIGVGSGRKVDPEELEHRFSRATMIEEACVVGQPTEGGEELCVVAVPAASVVAKWKSSPDALEAAIKEEVTLLSQDLPPYKRPSKIYLHPIRLPRTPTGDFRRQLVRTWLTAVERRFEPTRPSDESPARNATFRREGDYWTISYAGAVCRLRDTRGLQYIGQLLRDPGREFHVLDLMSTVARAPVSQGDVGPALDSQAKAAYRARLAGLREELSEAESYHDVGRAERARAEMEALTAELAGAVGLGGRDRVAAADAERARSAVTQGIRTAVRKISDGIPALGSHLARHVKTGTFCVYTPDESNPLSWEL